MASAKSLAKSLAITPNEAAKYGLSLNRDGHRRSAFELLAYPEIEWSTLRGIWPELSSVDPSIAVHLEIDAKYDVYLKRQTADVDAFRRLHEGRAALAPNPVAAKIQRDAIQPGGEFRLALEAAQGTERTEKCLLRDIASLFLPPDHPVGQGIDRPLPAQHQLVEAVQVAAARAGDQLFVTHH